MKTLEQLLAAWENGALNAGDAAELKRLLARPEARAELVGDWLLHGAIYESLHEERATRELAAQQAAESTARPAEVLAPSDRESAGAKAAFWRRLFPCQLWPEMGLRWRWAVSTAAVVVAAVGWVGWQVFLSRDRPAHNAAAGGPVVTQQALPPANNRSIAGVLTATRGEVWVTAAGRTNANIVRGADLTLHSGDAIHAGSNALARFTYPDESTLTIYSGTQLIVERTNATLRFELVRGAVDADIRPQPAGRIMKATTKFMLSDVLGTEFRLMAGSSSAWLGVRKGTVEVTRVLDGQKIMLGQANYAAVHPKWPYMRMNALVCPVWKSVCRQAAGTTYP